MYESYLRVYLVKEINKRFGISFDEFISRPRYEIETMVNIVNEVISKENKTAKEVLKDVLPENNSSI